VTELALDDGKTRFKSDVFSDPKSRNENPCENPRENRRENLGENQVKTLDEHFS